MAETKDKLVTAEVLKSVYTELVTNYETAAEAANKYQSKGSYLTEHQSLAAYETAAEAANKYQEKIDNLDTIVAGAALGATALQVVPDTYALKTDLPIVTDFVTMSTTQTVSGAKTFSDTVSITKAATPALTISNKGNTSSSHMTIGYDGITLKSSSSTYAKFETNNTFTNKFGLKINVGDGLARYVSFPKATKQVGNNIVDTLALITDIPDVTGMLTTSNYATTLGNVYQAKGDYVTAEAGKGLSTNDYTTEDQTFVIDLKKIVDISDTEDVSILSQCNESENGGGQLKIGSQCSNFYSYLNIISDGEGWEFYSKSIDADYFLYVGGSAVDLTKNTIYHFKQDGLYLNNSKITFSGSYNDLTNKPTLFSGSYNDLTDKPTIPDVSGKLDKITNQTAAAIVYAASKSGDTVTQTSYQLTSNATGSTAMFRDGNGRTKVATPVNDTEAANKGYVDGKVGSYKITSYTVDETAGTINLTIEDI